MGEKIIMQLENLKRMFEKRDDLRLVIETFNANVEPEEFDPLEVSMAAKIEDARTGEAIYKVEYYYEFDKLLVALDRKCKGD